MTRLQKSEHQRQRILDALYGPRTMVELRASTGISNQRLAQYLMRMTNTGEVKRTRDGKRPDGHPCFVYCAAVRETISAGEIGARLAANVNGGSPKEFLRPVSRTVGRPMVRVFGGLYVPCQP